MTSYELRCPSNTADIGRILLDLAGLVEEGGREVSGVYQWSGLENLSKWEMVQVVARVAGRDIGHLAEMTGR